MGVGPEMFDDALKGVVFWLVVVILAALLAGLAIGKWLL